jgi:hypothetical protein
MSGTRSNAECSGQHAELLPARTVLSTFTRASDGGHNGGGKNLLDGLKGDIPLLDKVLGITGNNADGSANGSRGSSGPSSRGL